MATLYEMAPEVKFLYELLQTEEIEPKVFKDTIEGLEVDKKLEGYVYIQRQLESDIEAFKRERDRLEDRIRTMQSNVQNIKARVVDFMNYTGCKNMEVGTFKLRLGKSVKAVVEDENLIPIEFLVEQKPKVNLSEIRKRLKEGEKIKGVSLSESEFLVIK